MRLTPEQRALARMVAAIGHLDPRTAARVVVLGPDRMRSNRVRETGAIALLKAELLVQLDREIARAAG